MSGPEGAAAQAADTARETVKFLSCGTPIDAWFYAPPEGAPAPAILMAHGITCVKDQYLDDYARRFNAAGYAVLVIDYRFLGASGGEPRGLIIPANQHDDLRASLQWLTDHPAVDAARIGLWGFSYSGGHVIQMAALDPRVKTVVALAPATDVLAQFRLLAGKEGLADLLATITAEQMPRILGAPERRVPVVAEPGALCLLPSPDSTDWFLATQKTVAPGWLNEVPMQTVGRMADYAPGHFIDLVSPKPIYIAAATEDALCPLAVTEPHFKRAGEPKRLDIFEGGHFDFFPPSGIHFEAASSAMLAWYEETL